MGPDCKPPVYCVGYEKEEIKAPCPCANQQGLKNKELAPCSHPCGEGEYKCNCKDSETSLDITKYFKCACLNNKFWTRKMCLCAEKPGHKDCECLPKNVQLHPKLKSKCCAKHNDKQYCDCQTLYEKYKGPTKDSMVEA